MKSVIPQIPKKFKKVICPEKFPDLSISLPYHPEEISKLIKWLDLIGIFDFFDKKDEENSSSSVEFDFLSYSRIVRLVNEEIIRRDNKKPIHVVEDGTGIFGTNEDGISQGKIFEIHIYIRLPDVDNEIEFIFDFRKDDKVNFSTECCNHDIEEIFEYITDTVIIATGYEKLSEKQPEILMSWAEAVIFFQKLLTALSEFK